MTVHLITYDLNKEVVRPKIVDAIRKLSGNWAKLSESSYAVSDDRSASEIYSVLEPMLDDNDNLYVIRLTAPYCGRGPADVNNWLQNHLSACTLSAY